MATINGTEQRSGNKVDLNLRGVNDQQHILSLQDVVAVPALPDLRESVPDHADIERYSDLLQNAVMTCLQNKFVELLIGANVQAAHRQLEFRIGPNEDPMLCALPLVGHWLDPKLSWTRVSASVSILFGWNHIF